MLNYIKERAKELGVQIESLEERIRRHREEEGEVIYTFNIPESSYCQKRHNIKGKYNIVTKK